MRTILILAAVLATATPAAAQVFDRGFAACSTSDTGHIFHHDYHTDAWVVDADVPLLPEGDYPYDATMRPCPWVEFWVPGAVGDGVVVVDGDGVITHRIPTGEYPVSIAFNESRRIALVSCRDSDHVDVVSTETYEVVGNLPIPNTYLGPGNIVYSIRGERFFMVAWYDDELFAIADDGSEILDRVPLGNDLWQVALAPESEGPLFVTDRGANLLRVVDTETLAEIRTVPVGDDPWGLDADMDFVVVACEDDATVHMVHLWDWSTTVIPLPADAEPRDVDLVVPMPVRGAKQLVGESAYVAGGTTAAGSPVFVIDLFAETLSDTFYLPGTNTNVVAVMPRLIVTGVDGGTPAPYRPTLQAAPNPFNPGTRIIYELDAAGPVDLAVYDLAGRWVRTLATGIRPAGERTAAWDGRDRAGDRVPSGTYVLRLRTRGGDESLKVTLLE
jgi:YVTN family beta-propeller protein